MNYTEIVEIEEWFDDQKWTLTKQQREKEKLNPIHKIFELNLKEFWSHLHLLDVIILAGMYQSAAYIAYYENIKNFRNFCLSTWQNKILDLRTLPPLTTGKLKQIAKMFHVNYLPIQHTSRYTRLFTLQLQKIHILFE